MSSETVRATYHAESASWLFGNDVAYQFHGETGDSVGNRDPTTSLVKRLISIIVAIHTAGDDKELDQEDPQPKRGCKPHLGPTVCYQTACHLTPDPRIATAVAPHAHAEQFDNAASGYVQDGKTTMSIHHVG